MDSSAREVLGGWETFYEIVGAAAAALTGLMLVAMTLVAESDHRRSKTAVGAFATPTLVQFLTAFAVSAVVVVPWPTLKLLAGVLAVIGASGVVYFVVAAVRARRQADYRPELSDWIWFDVLPLVAFAILAVAGGLVSVSRSALFAVAGVALALVLIAGHNAWDTITFLAVDSD
jgi:hypothetical protein